MRELPVRRQRQLALLRQGDVVDRADTGKGDARARTREHELAAAKPPIPLAHSGTLSAQSRKDRENGVKTPAAVEFTRLILERNGQRHREAHPAAVLDLVPDGGASPG